MANTPRATGLIQREIPRDGTDLHALAGDHGYRLVHTVTLDVAPLISGLIVAHHILEHAGPTYGLITDLAALITPVDIYPRGDGQQTSPKPGRANDRQCNPHITHPGIGCLDNLAFCFTEDRVRKSDQHRNGPQSHHPIM